MSPHPATPLPLRSQDVLLEALRRTPRRYRLPPLPAGIEAAREAAPDVALAFTIERRRRGDVAPELAALFTHALAALVQQSLAPGAGDAAFQALVMRAQHPHVEEHVRLAAQQHADRRAVRAAVDAFAHPGKLAAEAAGPDGAVLASLHPLARQGAWRELRLALQALPERAEAQSLLAHPALDRLERSSILLAHDAVQRYLALCGPQAGSAAANAQGRSAARTGDAAEREALDALNEVARLLDACGGDAHRAVRGLRTPPGFPGQVEKSKDEWDAVLLQGERVLLLAEVKASPSAATPDYARLLRGLQRLAHADPHEHYVFPAHGGEVRLAGDSLAALEPRGRELPPNVCYFCTSAPEVQPLLLSAASRAVLLAEPATIRYTASGLGIDALAPVWHSLASEPRLRSALHQDETSRAAREAMLHPRDLLAAVREVLG